MELWVRSQDKNNLKKVNNVYVEEITKDYDSWIGNIHSQPYVITSDNGNLGFYATKERALEVLDDIQNIISLHTSLAIVSQNVSILKLYIKQLEEEGFIDKYNSIKAVYQMPEE